MFLQPPVSIAQTPTRLSTTLTTQPYSIQHTFSTRSSLHQCNSIARLCHRFNRPRTTKDEELYVLTLLTSAKHQAEMSALRRKWFPNKFLKVDAHITLFYALPGSKLDVIRRDIGKIVKGIQRFEVKVGRENVFRMSKGLGVEMDKISLEIARGLRENLRRHWNVEDFGQHYITRRKKHETGDEKGWLSDQDARRGWNGHYTIMNKEEDTQRIGVCYRELKEKWHGSKGDVTGITLWRYEGGWWRKTEDFFFASHESKLGEHDHRIN